LIPGCCAKERTKFGGAALAAKMDGASWRTFVLTGDGELQEGSNWEAAMAAAHSSLMTPTSVPVKSERGLSTTIAWAHKNGKVTYVLEGNIYATGAAVEWLGQLLNLPDPGPGVEALAHTVVDSGGVYFVPSL
jgi:hypothetical protein